MRRRAAVLGPLLILVLATTAGVRSRHEWQHVERAEVGAWRGWAVVVGDAASVGTATRLTLALDGRRYDLWAYGGVARTVQRRAAGDRVWFEGTRSRFGAAASARRAAVRHVVGRCTAEFLGDVRDGPILAVAANRVRAVLRDAADTSMSPQTSALFTGLVIGDDLRQDQTTIDAFRASGLSHLTAVSGQNVAFVLLAAGPVLRRLRPVARWLATAALIGGFVVATRAEPSVLRAAVMAVLAATAFAVGRPVHPVRLLGLAVTALVLVDPFLVWSVAFWLSVTATAGVCVVGPAVEARLPGPPWWRAPTALTLGAQAGVALPSLLVFGRLPLVALVSNPAAAPVAGVVMLCGLPAAALARVAAVLGAPALGRLVMWPMAVGTRWVAEVATVASALQVPRPVTVVGWAAVVVGVVSSPPRTRVPI
ncbi:MAG: ComEC/Rec2 family competence protein [Ilumatobacteraceae bacterium]